MIAVWGWKTLNNAKICGFCDFTWLGEQNPLILSELDNKSFLLNSDSPCFWAKHGSEKGILHSWWNVPVGLCQSWAFLAWFSVLKSSTGWRLFHSEARKPCQKHHLGLLVELKFWMQVLDALVTKAGGQRWFTWWRPDSKQSFKPTSLKAGWGFSRETQEF